MNEYISFGISDGLEITNLHMRPEATVLPNMPLNFRYLTQLKLVRMAAEPLGKQLCIILLTGKEIIYILYNFWDHSTYI